MPIINATQSTWLTGSVWLPASGQANAVFSSFSSKQISDRNAATDIVYGAPYEKIWDVGHTYWQTDFTCPLLITQTGYIPTFPYYEGTQFIFEFLQRMLGTAGFNTGDSFTDNTLKDKWDFDYTENINSSNADYVIQKLSIDITDTESSFSVSILSTMDIRPYFKVFTNNSFIINSPLLNGTVYRTVSPYDISIPSDCIGAPFGFLQATAKQWPIQTNNLNAYTSLLKEFHLSLESKTIQVPSIGMPTSRTFLGVNSIQCNGNIKYIPLFYNGSTITFQEVGTTFAPAGFSVDTEAIDYIANSQRHGGKLHVSMDMVNPMYVQMLIKNRNLYIVNGKNQTTPIGPVSTSSWGLNTSGGNTNLIDVSFATSPGIVSF